MNYTRNLLWFLFLGALFISAAYAIDANTGPVEQRGRSRGPIQDENKLSNQANSTDDDDNDDDDNIHDFDGNWKYFKMQQKRKFKGSNSTRAERRSRRAFIKNMKEIYKYNEQDNATYTQDVNQFSDMPFEEFQEQYLTKLEVPAAGFLENTDPDVLPDGSHHRLLATTTSIDWRAKNKVTNVKNQGSCGACWAFSAVAAMESYSLIKTGSTLDLSEQELVDCSSSYGSNGCNGGWMTQAYSYVRDKKIQIDSSYPYKAARGTCVANSYMKNSLLIKGSYTVKGVDQLKAAVLKQPVAVGICVDANFNRYRSGIFTGSCTSLNHGVLVVGFTDTYWLVKNSWGTGWGEAGYIRIAMGNTIAIASNGVYPY